METSCAISLLVLAFGHLCGAQTQSPGTEPDVGEQDVWDELRHLRDAVVEQKVELRYLTERVTAAESAAEALEIANAAMEARMAAAESLAAQLQSVNEVQAAELADAQEKLSILQQRLTADETNLEELEKHQQGQDAALQELQNWNDVGKVAFSASLLQSGEGNTGTGDVVTLVFKNVFTNIGNHYNPNTGYFTAPVRALYYFRFTGHLGHTDNAMLLRLLKNEDFILASGDGNADPEDSASGGVVLQLEEGDVVSVQCFGKVWDDQYHRTTFSGFLLFPL